MKITLVNIGNWEYPPLGLAYIASYLRKYLDFYEITIVEGENVVQKIKRCKPDVVGFTSVTAIYNRVLKAAKEVKNELDIPTIIGGSHITSLPHTLPREFDIGVIGEGEQTMLELVKLFLNTGEFNTSELKKIKGICYHNGDKVEITPMRELIDPLDNIPYPARDLLDMRKYLQSCDILSTKQFLRGVTMMTSRGCPYHCVFCQASQIWRRIRYYSAEYVVSEIKYIVEKYNEVEAINIIDDLCIADKARLRKIVDLLRNEGLTKRLIFNINGKANLMDEDRFKLLKDMNVVQVSVGFESGSEKVLNYLKKGTDTVEQNKRAMRLSRKYGISIGGQFMVGTPGETEEDMMKTFKFIKKYPMSHINLNVTTPLPGTELWKQTKEKGLVNEDMDWDKLTLGFLPNSDDGFYIGDCMSKDKFIQKCKEIREYCDVVNAMPISGYFNYLRRLSTFKGGLLHPKNLIHLILNSVRKIMKGANK